MSEEFHGEVGLSPPPQTFTRPQESRLPGVWIRHSLGPTVEGAQVEEAQQQGGSAETSPVFFLWKEDFSDREPATPRGCDAQRDPTEV